MKIKTLLLLTFIFSNAFADCGSSWNVDINAGIIGETGALTVQSIVSAKVDEGKCWTGIERTENMPLGKIKVQQKVCISGNNGISDIKGWIFLNKRQARTADPLIIGEHEQQEFNYGLPIDISTDGSLVSSNIGPYQVSAKRNEKRKDCKK